MSICDSDTSNMSDLWNILVWIMYGVSAPCPRTNAIHQEEKLEELAKENSVLRDAFAGGVSQDFRALGFRV